MSKKKNSMLTFGPSINQRFVRLWRRRIGKADQSCIQPSACFDRIQTANDEVKLRVEAIVFILYAGVVTASIRSTIGVRRDTAAGHALFDKIGGGDGFGLADVSFAVVRNGKKAGPEKKLAIQIAQVDGVHVDDVDVGEAEQGERG